MITATVHKQTAVLCGYCAECKARINHGDLYVLTGTYVPDTYLMHLDCAERAARRLLGVVSAARQSSTT